MARRKKRRLGKISKLDVAANGAASYCEQEFGGPNFSAVEDACKHGVNRTIRILRKLGKDV